MVSHSDCNNRSFATRAKPTLRQINRILGVAVGGVKPNDGLGCSAAVYLIDAEKGIGKKQAGTVAVRSIFHQPAHSVDFMENNGSGITEI